MIDLVRQNDGDHYIAVNNNHHPGAGWRTQPDVGAKKLVTMKNENVKCFQNIFYFHLDDRDKDHSLARFRIMSKFKMETVETIWIHIFHMPEMKCWHHPWISAR